MEWLDVRDEDAVAEVGVFVCEEVAEVDSEVDAEINEEEASARG